ncbi:MAG: S-formylglutathione hydrolase [Alphaproteobacteria bacterium]|jgi:S-formylglutathione hydrolase|nr:S-formylglutathione hydrolase [Alphaproteobacteria bacterium]
MVETKAEYACFGGTQGVYAHDSDATGTAMEFSVYVPPAAADGPCPVLYYLSGLTCTWENVTIKAGAQHWCAEHGVIFVAPDTSPRGEAVPDDPEYDFGQGAGFYVDATQAPWHRHFRMERYVVEELPTLIADRFPVRPGAAGVTGHSMGGHGALTLALRHPDVFRTVSAFAPIVAPTRVPWGQKAFAGYLGDRGDAWADHDACRLIESRGWAGDILVDQGEADGFLDTQLKPELLAEACDAAGVPLMLRRHAGYDHSYWFVQTFIGDHVAWHAARLG